MPVGKLQSQLVVAQSAVCIPQAPASPALTHSVKQLLGNQQMALMVLDGGLKVPHQSVSIAKTVASLCF